MSSDILQVQGINEKGYGLIPKLVMQDRRLTIQAKAIYAYFCSYAGTGKTAFPGRNKIIYDLNISINTYYTHFKLLKEYGYIKAGQEKDKGGSFKRNVYTLMETVPCTNISDTEDFSEIQDSSTSEDESSPDVLCSNISDAENIPNAPCTNISDTVNSSAPPCINSWYTQIWDTKICDTNNNIDKYKQIYKNISQSSQSKKADGQDGDRTDCTAKKIEACYELVKENICYEDLISSRPRDVNLINEFVSIIVDVLVSDSNYICVDSESKPRVLVQNTFMKLTFEDIGHTIDQFKSITKRIFKKKPYIITMLYNNKHEFDAHYTNLVKHDMHY